MACGLSPSLARLGGLLSMHDGTLCGSSTLLHIKYSFISIFLLIFYTIFCRPTTRHNRISNRRMAHEPKEGIVWGANLFLLLFSFSHTHSLPSSSLSLLLGWEVEGAIFGHGEGGKWEAFPIGWFSSSCRPKSLGHWCLGLFKLSSDFVARFFSPEPRFGETSTGCHGRGQDWERWRRSFFWGGSGACEVGDSTKELASGSKKSAKCKIFSGDGFGIGQASGPWVEG